MIAQRYTHAHQKFQTIMCGFSEIDLYLMHIHAVLIAHYL